jgi:hypothetical protein
MVRIAGLLIMQLVSNLAVLVAVVVLVVVAVLVLVWKPLMG